MNNHRFLIRIIISISAMLLFYGCSTTPASHFYLLNVSDETRSLTTEAPKEKDLYIGIGPVSFPEYLDRPQIVTRSENSELYLAELHRWAEPLKENFTRVFAEHISQMVGTNNISIEPSRNRDDLDFRIFVDIIQFDINSFGEVVLVGYYRIENTKDQGLITNQKSTIKLTVSGSLDYEVIVNGLSQAVKQFAREISIEINNQ